MRRRLSPIPIFNTTVKKGGARCALTGLCARVVDLAIHITVRSRQSCSRGCPKSRTSTLGMPGIGFPDFRSRAKPGHGGRDLAHAALKREGWLILAGYPTLLNLRDLNSYRGRLPAGECSTFTRML